MSGGELTRLQRAFDRCAREEKAEWLRGIALGMRPAGYFDIPNAQVGMGHEAEPQATVLGAVSSTAAPPLRARCGR